MPAKLLLIKNEMYSQYQVIAMTQVQKTFVETYGNNYDVNSLNSSLLGGHFLLSAIDIPPLFLF